MSDQEDFRNDKEELIGFLADLRDALSYTVEMRRELLPEHLHVSIIEAWPEVEKEIKDVIDEIEETWDEVKDKLHDGGLRGRQFRFKWEGIKKAFRDWVNNKAKKPLLRFLSWANILLGSLALFFPQVDLIKEFKESVEKGIQETQ